MTDISPALMEWLVWLLKPGLIISVIPTIFVLLVASRRIRLTLKKRDWKRWIESKADLDEHDKVWMSNTDHWDYSHLPEGGAKLWDV